VLAGFGLIAWAVLIAMLVLIANVILHVLEKRFE
jgi:uncharacterized membrane protein YhiD involved in acid resistance